MDVCVSSFKEDGKLPEGKDYKIFIFLLKAMMSPLLNKNQSIIRLLIRKLKIDAINKPKKGT